MATSNGTGERSLIDGLIRPAIMKLVSESEGMYRCERDLHHHFTVCLAHVTSLELGTPRRRVRMEEPTLACYGSGRKGNLDYFFPSDQPSTIGYGPREGVAVELNYNYDGYSKIKKDMQKLIDPDSAYGNSLYFAYGTKRGFYKSVTSGIERAFNEFAEARPDFRLPLGLHVVVVEHVRGGGHVTHESSVTAPCAPAELSWVDAHVAPLLGGPAQAANEETHLIRDQGAGAGVRYIDRQAAEILLQAEMEKVEIPLNSKTARCMFERTVDSHGQNRCKFGVTPLWGNELKVVNGKVLRSEFMDWVQRLCRSGHAFQRAARASWAKSQ